MSSSNCCFLTAYRFLRRQLRWSGIPISWRVFHSLLWSTSLTEQLVKESTCNAGDPSSIPGLGRSAGEGIGYPLQYPWASLVAQLVKLQCGRPGFVPCVGKIPWRRERLPTPVFWPEEFHGPYSIWDHKESDTTERLALHFTQSKALA